MLTAWAVLCAPAAAATQPWVPSEVAVAARLSEVGTWEFSATRLGPDHQSECFETWTFNPDGSGSIISGKQRVTTRWELKRYEGIGQFVFFTDLASTEGPDCLGHVFDTRDYPQSRQGFQLLFYADGEGALVCFEGAEITRPDGSRYNRLGTEDCWGRIVPAAKRGS